MYDRNQIIQMVLKQFTASIHTHVRSQFDAQIAASKLTARILELGGLGCVITDHGVVSSIEDYRPAFKKAGLKLIPGCEFYVDGGVLGRLHMVGIAVNDHGWKGIAKLVTEANRNMDGSFPVLSLDALREICPNYKGDIIFTSACIQGIIPAILLQNKKVEEQIEKLVSKQNDYINPSSKEVVEAEGSVKKVEEALTNAQYDRDDYLRAEEEKIRGKKAELKASQKSMSEEEKELAKAEIKALEDAFKLKKKDYSANIAALKKSLTAVRKDNQKVLESVEKYLNYEVEIQDLRKKMLSDEELYEKAISTTKWFSNLFGEGNFYLEVQYHGIKEEAKVYPVIVKIARELNLPLIASNDVHLLTNSEDERLRRCILRSLRFGEEFEEEGEGDAELYLKDNFELKDWLCKIIDEDAAIEALNNIEVVFNRCNVEFKTEKHYPKWPNAVEELKKAVEEGIAWRFPNGFPEGKEADYRARIEKELEVICGMGYADYHMVVKDYLEYGRLLGKLPADRIDEAPLTIDELKKFIVENGWEDVPCYRIGNGRGSAVGSLVCYLIGIVAIDPMKYDLLFERFLNPERISMPDIDSDFANLTRGKVIEYVDNKYGMVQIMTTDAKAPKGSIRIAAKYYGKKAYGEALTSLGDMIAKAVPNDVGTSFATKVTDTGVVDKKEGTLTVEEFLKKKFAGNKDAQIIIKWATVVEGSFTTYSAHASGILTAADIRDFSDALPLRWNSKIGCMTTQCDMVQCEENGFLKFDFLGLKTCDIIDETIKLVYKRYGVKIDPLTLDVNDEKVLKHILATGKTNSVFQFESVGMKSMLKRFKPSCFEDLIILVAMFRPGPLQYLDGVIDVKNGVKPMTFLCPEMEHIVGKTYGATVYQEQVMQICQDLAGFSLGEADIIRRHMAKKHEVELAEYRDVFVNGNPEKKIPGCVANGIDAEIANTIFDQMMDFASYAFNKSHAAVYAFIAYITAWLKYYYPTEFFTAALNWAEAADIPGLMYEATAFGVEVKAPSINASMFGFSIDGKAVYFGLSAVAGVNTNASTIIEERKKGEFTSLKNFYLRVRPDSRTIINLIKAGAFDEFSSNRFAMLSVIEEMKAVTKVIKDKQSFIASSELVLPLLETSTIEEIVETQLNAGMKAEIKEMTTVDKLQKRIDNAKVALETKLADFDTIIIPTSLKEDKNKRMLEEKEMLGMYVTEHPMDYYPSPEEVEASAVSEILPEENAVCYGVISNLEIKNRKKDGKPMAFFNIEDRSGSIPVAVFTKAYASLASSIKEGAVVKLTGNCVEEETGLVSDEGEVLYEKKFYANKLANVEAELSSVFMSVSSYAVFHVTREEEFIKKYADKSGHPLVIFDESLDEMRQMKYKVSDVLLKEGLVEEI